MWHPSDYPITVALTGPFDRQALRVFSCEEMDSFISHLAYHPDGGLVIPGTGGIRKIRWPAKSQGKRSGARVIYYFRDLNMPLYLLAVYTKGEKIDVTSKEKKEMQRMVESLVCEHSRKWDQMISDQLVG